MLYYTILHYSFTDITDTIQILYYTILYHTVSNVSPTFIVIIITNYEKERKSELLAKFKHEKVPLERTVEESSIRRIKIENSNSCSVELQFVFSFKFPSV